MNLGRLRLWFIASRSHLHTSTSMSWPLSLCRYIASVPDFEENLIRNPYYEKYAKKIHELQKTSPEDFSLRVEECKQHKTNTTLGHANVLSPAMSPKEALDSVDKEHYQMKALSDVMNIDLIQDMSAKEVSEIWETHYKNKHGISATIPADVYNLIYEKGELFPVFVIPLPREQGYEFFLCQVEKHEVHFTSLINYQTHKENAPECLTIVHFIELENKGIVLMRGEYNEDSLNAKEAQCLANQFQLYYGKANEKRLKLLKRFNHNPNDFKHMDLIAEMEFISLDSS